MTLNDYDDYAWEMAISALHDEAMMARAAREQCIFVFVEGKSEEVAIPILMTDVIDLDALGVKIANYNGRSNLSAALRLMKMTLSHDRPIIITYDNDPPSIKSVEECRKQNLLTDLTYTVPIPTETVVKYSSGHIGGAFEEAFPLELFLDVAFTEAFLPKSIVLERRRFEKTFVPNRPWLPQLRKFSANLGFTDWSAKKPALAESLADNCDDLPPTFSHLTDLIKKVRKEHPVVHPDDVELPWVPGLTDFPKKESPTKGMESDE